MTQPDSKFASEFIQAQHYQAVSDAAPRVIRRVFIHSMENVDKPGTAKGVAVWFSGKARAPAPVASAHYCCDGSGPSVVQCVREADVAYAAPGANHDGIHVELAGMAKQSTSDWLADSGLLDVAANLVADILTNNDIPPTFVDAEGLLRDEQGVSTHHQVTLACALAKQRMLTGSEYYPAQNNHTDPGQSYPMDHFLEMIRGRMTWPDASTEPAA